MRVWALSLVLLGASTAVAGQSWESGPERVQMLELFTSEGCNSCPPADRWLSGMMDDPGLWRRIVPVALHVDYWDRLGWPDRFARPGFSTRQRDLALWDDGQVYTPGFFVDGHEWRGWFRGGSLPATDDGGGGYLRLEEGQGTVRVQFTPTAEPDGLVTVHVARLGFGLETPVGAGENRGVTLRHDFVVTGYDRREARRDGGLWVVDVPLPETVATGPREALVAWVTAGGSPQPVQAVGGWRGTDS